jgi:hypothetical protein
MACDTESYWRIDMAKPAGWLITMPVTSHNVSYGKRLYIPARFKHYISTAHTRQPSIHRKEIRGRQGFSPIKKWKGLRCLNALCDLIHTLCSFHLREIHNVMYLGFFGP